ncbi:MAG: zinc ribbon domain-containing protein [Firmicutes bacterium]|nr:zinc ribbon domain-containing protein [Bacillota bacterium]
MNKCFKCGNEFEGAFCPQCGTKYVKEKVCPDCHATVDGNVKFCNYCGYAFDSEEKSAVKKKTRSYVSSADMPDFWNIMSKVLPKLSIFIFALFSLLTWAFFAAPFANFFGISLGNVYTTINGTIDDYLPIAQSSLAFAVIGVAYAVVAIVLIFAPATSHVKAGKATLTQILSACGCLLYIPFIVLGGETMAKTKEIGAESEAFAGVIIAFSVVFLVFSLAAVISDVVLTRKIAAYQDAIDAQRQLQLERIEQRRQIKAERREKAVKILEENNVFAPAELEHTDVKIYKALDKAYDRNIIGWAIGAITFLLIKLMIRFASYVDDRIIFWINTVIETTSLILWSLLIFFAVSGTKGFADKQRKKGTVVTAILLAVVSIAMIIVTWVDVGYTSTNGVYAGAFVVVGKIMYIIILYHIVGVLTTALYLMPKANDKLTDGYLQSTTLFRYKRFSVANLVLTIVVLIFGTFMISAIRGTFIDAILLWIPYLVQLVVCANGTALCRSMFKTFGINKKGYATGSFEMSLTLDSACEQAEQYAKYRQNKNYYSASLKRAEYGLPLIAKDQHIKKVGKFKMAVALTLAAIIFVGSITYFAVDEKNPFKTAKVSAIKYGNMLNVEQILGKADVESGNRWSYYSSNYLKVMEETEELLTQLKNAPDLETAQKIQTKIDNLAKRAQKMTYKYIHVTFDAEGRVSDVKYDFHYNPSKAQQQTLYGVADRMNCELRFC